MAAEMNDTEGRKAAAAALVEKAPKQVPGCCQAMRARLGSESSKRCTIQRPLMLAGSRTNQKSRAHKPLTPVSDEA